MSDTKIDFITDLLKSNKLDSTKKERIFALSAKELNKESKEIEKIWAEIVNLKSKFGATNIESFSKQKNQNLENIKKTPHRPKDVADFMSLFNLPSGLKYLTHDFDEGGEFDIEEFLKIAKEVFQTNIKYPKSIPQSLQAIVNQFAFSGNPKWGTGFKITDGWSKPEWIEWSKKHKKHLKRNSDFEKVIESFRNYTRVESPKLTIILNEVLKEKFGSEFEKLDLKIIDCDKADFYTHVDNFKEAIKLMLDGMKKRVNISNKITINYLRKTNGDYFERIIKICHHNSFPTKPRDEFINEIAKEEKGELGDISRRLRGYCNWSIETVWDDEPIRINILQETGEIGVDFLDKSVPLNGFTHILTFYYK